MLTARLNVDVLTMIISEFLTDDSDVLSFTLVSSSLRPVANSRLLSMRPISLRRDVCFRSFHNLIFADPVIRAPHVRVLHVGGRRFPRQLIPLQPSGFSSLAVDITSSCDRLKHVTMFFEQGSTDDDEPVVLAIAALTTLRSLTVSGWSAETLHLLRHLSSPIRKLAINSAHVTYPDILDEFLPRLAPSLEELELLYFRVHRGMISDLDDASRAPDAFLSLTQYPAVRSLSVLCLTGSPLLDRLHHLFPRLDGTLALGLYDALFNRSSIDDVRAANRRAQEPGPTGTGTATGGRAWTKLDRVVCDALMLYALALRCPVRLVMLDKGTSQADMSQFAAAALRENPVPRLKVTLRCARGVLDAGGIFGPELAGTLRHLTLCLVRDDRKARAGTEDDAAEDADGAPWGDVLDTMLPALRPLQNLTHLRIVVNCKDYTRPVPSSSTSTSTNPASAQAERFVESVRASAFDFAGTAASLARALPALQYIFLTTSGSLTDRDVAAAPPWRAQERWNVSRAWRVAGSASDPGVQDGHANAHVHAGLVELHSDVAETIVRREELVLSETDEAALFSSKGARREVSGIGADE